MSYNCRICGKTYDALEEVMKHEQFCLNKKKRDVEFQKQEKLKAEREVRKAEVEKAFKIADDKYNEAVELEKKYEEDYGFCVHSIFPSDIFERMFVW
jgi:predicted  nucleic acid-binding Zn-ribbon protein